MKQIAIISGKGGTGKTSITSAFASLAKNSIYADCDVNASDLHIIMRPKVKESFVFSFNQKVKINQQECIKCSICFNVCRFNAVDRIRNNFYVREFSCTGCDLCRKACPVMAIEKIDNKAGEYFISDTRFGQLVHSRLNVGEDYSDRLIDDVKSYACNIAEEKKLDNLIIDGPPGIGCTTISTINGIDLAVLITNSSKSSLHDLKRSLELLKTHNIKASVIINKSNFNCNITKEIEEYCLENGISFLGKIPYDRNFTYGMLEQKSIIEYAPFSATSDIIRKIWEKILKL